MNSRTIAHFIRLQPSILHYVELGRQCGKAGEETVGDRDAYVAAKRTRYSSFLTSVANAEAACSPYPPSCDTWFSKRDPRLADTSTTRTIVVVWDGRGLERAVSNGVPLLSRAGNKLLQGELRVRFHVDSLHIVLSNELRRDCESPELPCDETQMNTSHHEAKRRV